MVIMDPYYPPAPDRLRELWQTIDHLHLSYLEMEESSEKLDHRKRLEECIREYLCMAPSSHKFCFRETAEVLQRSASSKVDFSGYKAATGWNALQLYAGNLLSQPWRKEYRQLKTYSGFYKHQIEAHLVGADLIFEIMGYKHYGKGVLILDGPICPDQVTSVSKDCLIAYVECQIMKLIWEEISPKFKITWLDVLDFRSNYACSPEQSISALNYQLHQKTYENNFRCQNPTNPVPPFIYATNYCPTYAHVTPNPYTVIKPPVNNGYYCNGFYTHHPVYGYGVPTAQLIELGPSNLNNNNNFDEPDGHNNKKNKKRIEENIEETNEGLEDWDYVYRDLKNQGYSKDLGERGDILSPSKPTDLDEANMDLERPLKFAQALEKFNEIEEKERNDKIRKKKTSETNKKERTSENDSKKMAESSQRWECKSCTYLNKTGDICEMCSKSRVNVEQKMEIGGPQCSKCTLVNLKDAKLCQACGSSLKDSPTYI